MSEAQQEERTEDDSMELDEGGDFDCSRSHSHLHSHGAPSSPSPSCNNLKSSPSPSSSFLFGAAAPSPFQQQQQQQQQHPLQKNAHASFDMSLLRSNTNTKKNNNYNDTTSNDTSNDNNSNPSASTGAAAYGNNNIRGAASWDEYEYDKTATYSAHAAPAEQEEKQQQQQQQHRRMRTMMPPQKKRGTPHRASSLFRSNSNSSNNSNHKSSNSVVRKSSASFATTTATATTTAAGAGTTTTTTPSTCTKRQRDPSDARGFLEDAQQESQQQQQLQSMMMMAPRTVRKPKRPLGAAAAATASDPYAATDTAASLFDNNSNNINNSTNLNDSIDSHESTGSNFRFSMHTFPASLPRIQNNNNGAGAAELPIRTSSGKRPPSDCGSFDFDESDHSENNLNDRDDDDDDDKDDDDDDDGSTLAPVTRTRLQFHDEDDDDDDMNDSNHQHNHNHNNHNENNLPLRVGMPANNDDGERRSSDSMADHHHHHHHHHHHDRLLQPYEHDDERVHSFASSVSSVTKHNLSESFCGEENITASTAGLSPSRASSNSVTASAPAPSQQQQQQQHSNQHSQAAPGTPHEVRLYLNTAHCSPIPGIPEEETCSHHSGMSSSAKTNSSSSNTNRHRHKSNNNSNLNRSSTSITSSGAFPSRARSSTSLASTDNNANGAASIGGNSSGGASGRPKPDLAAFDGGNDTSLQSSSHFYDVADRARHSVPKLLCPPTPARTPAWACDEDDDEGPGDFVLFTQKRPGLKKKKMERHNSLIATKVLATCSAQVLDGRASLENSILEKSDNSSVLPLEEASHKSTTKQRRVSNSTTVTTASEMTNRSGGGLPMKHSRPSELDWLHDHQEEQQQQQQDHSLSSNTRAAQLKIDTDNDESDLEVDETETRGGQQQQQQQQHPQTHHPVVVSMSESFDVLSTLGRGNFADVYRVRSKQDGRLYAIKRVRQQFRGRRDREAALSEVRSMQRLQSHMASPTAGALPEQQQQQQQHERASHNSLYLLFFFQAWQEEGHFFCQTELCCRDTCREMIDALRSQWHVAKSMYPSLQQLPAPPQTSSSNADHGRWMPEDVVWKICHDIGAGLSHIHAHGLVHNDIKPSNIFFVSHPRFGALCKIGDFGNACNIGGAVDGQEGDQKYMAFELLDQQTTMQPSADIFSLGLTLYELASNLGFVVPSEGSRWQEIRSGQDMLDVPACRSAELVQLVRQMLHPTPAQRPLADTILSSSPIAAAAGRDYNRFLHDYIGDVENWEQRQEDAAVRGGEQTPRHAGRTICSPTFGFSVPTLLHSSPAAPAT